MTRRSLSESVSCEFGETNKASVSENDNIEETEIHQNY